MYQTGPKDVLNFLSIISFINFFLISVSSGAIYKGGAKAPSKFWKMIYILNIIYILKNVVCKD